jgi:hypothetical protein
MNCFEVRSDFVAFWQKTLARKHRAQLLTHMNGCAQCDRAFRMFALTAPVLYSAVEPQWDSSFARPLGFNPDKVDGRGGGPRSEYRPAVRTVRRFLPALVMAAAAAIALYFAAPPHMTFEDAIAADNPNNEIASYPATDSFFGQELMAQGTAAPGLADD